MPDLLVILSILVAALLGAGVSWLVARRRTEHLLAARAQHWQQLRSSLESQARRQEGEVQKTRERIENLKDQLAACEWQRKADVGQLAAANERADKLAAQLLASRAELASFAADRKTEDDALADARKRLRQIGEAVEISRAALVRQRSARSAMEQQHAADLAIHREQIDGLKRALVIAEERIATLSEQGDDSAERPARKPKASARKPRPAAKPQAAAKADSLRRIRGIGPALEQQLHEAGIRTFEQIAAWDPESVARDTNGLSVFRARILRDDWIGQARDLRDRAAGR